MRSTHARRRDICAYLGFGVVRLLRRRSRVPSAPSDGPGQSALGPSTRQQARRQRALSYSIGWLILTTVAVLTVADARADLPPGGTFIDDDGIRAEGYIESLVAAGVVRGCDAGGTLYCPGATLSRGQMAAFLARARNLPPASQDYFWDDNGTTHEDAINRLADNGIAQGVGNGAYDPSGQISRGQIAAFVVRAFSLAPSWIDWFDDDNGSNQEFNINSGRSADVLEPCAAGTRFYCPTDPLLRSDMAVLVAKASGLAPSPPPPRNADATTSTSVAGSTSSTTATTGSTSTSSTATTGPTSTTSTSTTTSTPPGSPNDGTVLTSFSRSSPDTVSAGDNIAFPFALDQGGSPANRVQVRIIDSIGGVRFANAYPSSGETSGVAVEGVTTSWVTGAYTIDRVLVYDDDFRFVIYYRDGTVEPSPAGLNVPETHGFDFPALDFVVD